MKRNNIYYKIKPLIPRWLQLYIRCKIVRWKLPHYNHVWPIDYDAAKPPENWQGWPDGKKFALVLTHDIETKEGLDKCRILMQMEQRLGFRSAFNFVAEDYLLPPELIRTITDNGFEVGMHGLNHNGNMFSSKECFDDQAIKINQYLKQWDCKGFRSPSMYRNLEWIHELEIEYDASTFDTDPFEPQPGGMRTIFPIWIPNDSGMKGYVELPYTLPQDFLLFILMQEQNIDIWKKKLDWIADNGGMALLITHPDYMNFDQKIHYEKYSAKYYEEFLNYIKLKYKGQYWNVLPREVARWCGSHPHKINTHSAETRPKRICMVVYSFYESDNRVLRYAETLVREGDQVDVIALKSEGSPTCELLRGVNIQRIQKRKKDEKGKFSYLYRLLKFFILSSVLLTWQHIKNPYKLIHVHNMPDFLVFVALIPKLLGAKVILDIHDVVPELYMTKFNQTQNSLLFKFLLLTERVSCSFADHVIIANHLWHKLIVSRSVKEAKCSVVMNYPDENVFFRRPRSRQDDKFIMIYPGSLNLRQGVDLAIKAFSIISDKVPSAEFHIYGQGGDIKILENLITESELQERILFKGSLPIYEVANEMANADLGIEPKRNDIFAGSAMSTKIFEFMSLGIPVIVSDTEVHKYYFNDTEVLFFKSDDEQDLARCMLLLIENADLRQTMTLNNSKFIQEYLWDKRKDEYLGLINKLVQR